MKVKKVLRRDEIIKFIARLYDGDLHAKRVLSLANATLGVLTSASLAVYAMGQGLAQAMGKLSKHRVKQVDRLLSHEGVDVWEFFGHWVPRMVGIRSEVVVALDWTSFARNAHETISLAWAFRAVSLADSALSLTALASHGAGCRLFGGSTPGFCVEPRKARRCR